MTLQVYSLNLGEDLAQKNVVNKQQSVTFALSNLKYLTKNLLSPLFVCVY